MTGYNASVWVDNVLFGNLLEFPMPCMNEVRFEVGQKVTIAGYSDIFEILAIDGSHAWIKCIRDGGKMTCGLLSIKLVPVPFARVVSGQNKILIVGNVETVRTDNCRNSTSLLWTERDLEGAAAKINAAFAAEKSV